MSWVGIPYLDLGRTRAGADCYGLIRLVLSEDAGIDLPIYGEISSTELLAIARTIDRAAHSEIWLPVGEPRALDVVVMKRQGEPAAAPHPEARWHLGIMLSAAKMLHTERLCDSHVVPLSHPSLKGRVTGFYRHRDLP